MRIIAPHEDGKPGHLMDKCIEKDSKITLKTPTINQRTWSAEGY